MSERPKELASKASVAQVTEGSNPSATAEEGPRRETGPFLRPERNPAVIPEQGAEVTLAAVNRGPQGTAGTEEAAVAVNSKKVAVYVLVVFVLYVIITDPSKAADYVQIGFEGISDAAKALGDFASWVANGGDS